MNQVIKQSFAVKFKYNIHFTKNIFNIKNTILNKIINKNEDTCKKKIIVLIDKKVSIYHKNLKNDILNYFSAYEKTITLTCSPITISGGEKIKNHFFIIKYLYKLISTYKICRKSFIVGIGGGAFLDAIGYAASTAHRGVKLIRIPTTVLSQNDSGIGVKNGINFMNKKNFIGTFTTPFAVINDYKFLTSLSNRDWIAGVPESIKVSLIKDDSLFELIKNNVDKILNRNIHLMKKIIFYCAKLHANHISKNGDPFETTSSRPLDFGHWSAHKLESLTKYKLLHGESVAIGIAIDCTYSYLIKLLKKSHWKTIIKTLIKLKLDIFNDKLSLKKGNKNIISEALQEFREHIGGKLTITLIKQIGKSVDINHINIKILEKSIKYLEKYNYKIKKNETKK